jgi:phage-related protein
MSDFNWSPSYDNDKALNPKLHKAKFGDGYEQRTGAGLNNNLGEWNLTFNKDNTTIDAIEAFFNARIQGESFTWIPLGEATQIRVVWSQMNRRRPSFNHSVLSVKFSQVPG